MKAAYEDRKINAKNICFTLVSPLPKMKGPTFLRSLCWGSSSSWTRTSDTLINSTNISLFICFHPSSISGNPCIHWVFVFICFHVLSKFKIEDIDFTLNEFEKRFRFGSKRSKIDLFAFRESVVRDLELSERSGYARNNRDTIRSLKRFHRKPFCTCGKSTLPILISTRYF